MESIKAFDKGTYDWRGFSLSGSENYFVRWNDFADRGTPRERNRCFFAFDLSNLQSAPSQCRLRLEVPEPLGVLSINEAETFSIHQIPVAYYEPVLQDGRQFVFHLLGTGIQFGEALITRADVGDSKYVEMNPDAITAISWTLQQAAVNDRKLFLVGGRLIPSGFNRGDRRLFRGSARCDVFLDVSSEN